MQSQMICKWGCIVKMLPVLCVEVSGKTTIATGLTLHT
jgi:hypothetical protein